VVKIKERELTTECHREKEPKRETVKGANYEVSEAIKRSHAMKRCMGLSSDDYRGGYSMRRSLKAKLKKIHGA